jgi:hypothetical protein
MDMRAYGKTSYYKVSDFDDVNEPVIELIVSDAVGKWDKPVLNFLSGKKLSLNKTNVDTLIKAWGAESANWVDHEVELYVDTIPTQQGVTNAVLVRPITTPPKPAKRAALPTEVANVEDTF